MPKNDSELAQAWVSQKSFLVLSSGANVNGTPILRIARNMSVQISGTFSADFAFDVSNDDVSPTNWIEIISASVVSGYGINDPFKWYRGRVLNWVSGTVIMRVSY